jgi:hypothetical protein
VPTLLLAAVALAMHLTGLTGVDSAAHAYKIQQLHQSLGALLWDSSWYGGAYGVIGYGPLYYLCALVVPGAFLVVLAAGSLPLLFHLYLRRIYRVRSLLPPVALAVVLCFYLSNGQDPFLFGLAFMMGGLVLVSVDRPALAALAAGLALFCNPLALLMGAIFLLADFIARAEWRRRYLLFAAWVLPFLVARAVLTLLFSEPSRYLDDVSQLWRPLVLSLAGAALAFVSRREDRRHLAVLFLCSAAVSAAVLAAQPLPVGNNVARFVGLFGGPLVLAVGWPRLRWPRRLPLPAFCLAAVFLLTAWLQLATPARHLFAPPHPQAADAAFFAPALQWLAAHPDRQHRLHVVALAKHWEAYYFPRAGYPITRGWYRQEDAIHNGLFLPPHYSSASYLAWLRSMGVRYVLLPHAPLDFSSLSEPGILAHSPAVRVVAQLSNWTIYELRHPGALLVPMTRTGAGHIIDLGHRSTRLQIDTPGAYVLHITWSPYWRVVVGAGDLARAQGDWILLRARQAGIFEINFG